MIRFALVALATLLVACGEPRARTQVMLVIDADAALRARATSLRVVVGGRDANAVEFDEAFSRTFTELSAESWPHEIAILPEGNDATRRFDVRIELFESGSSAPIVSTRVESGFVPRETRVLRVFVPEACVALVCAEGSSCRARSSGVAACLDERIPASALPPYGEHDTDAGTDASIDGCDAGAPQQITPTPPMDAIDLLFVIDNSGSMREEQLAMRNEFPRIVAGLVSGDPDNNPLTPNYPPAASLRVAVVSSDLGVGGIGVNPSTEAVIPLCGKIGLSDTANAFEAHYGDNGSFNRAPLGAPNMTMAAQANCDGSDVDSTPDTLTTGTLPSFLTFDPTGSLDDAAFADRISCYAVLGTDGCGFEQQLESMLKSVTPSTSNLRFHAAASSAEDRGQGDRENAGWLREDALLAVLMVTDEDDCSAADPRVFNWEEPTDYTDSPANGAQANSRCVRYGDEPVENNPNPGLPSLLHPTSRYADALIALKDNDPSRVVFALITGVPVASVNGTGPNSHNNGIDNLDDILDPSITPAMKVTLITSQSGAANGTVAPSCSRCAFGYPAATCALGWNDLDGDMMRGAPCVDMDPPVMGQTNKVCDPGEALNCTVENNGMPGCQIDETELSVQTAVPPRRLVRAARAMQGLGIKVVVQSICQDSFTPTTVPILSAIAGSLLGGCVHDEPTRNPVTGLVPCNLEERLPPGMTCASLPGRTLLRVDGVQICAVTQVPIDAATRASGEVSASAPAGFYLDDFTPRSAFCGGADPARISLTNAATQVASSFTLSCGTASMCE